MRELTELQREALATLNCDNAGLYEHPDTEDRMLVGAERIRSVFMNAETGSDPLRVLIVAPSTRHDAWTAQLHDTLARTVPVDIKTLGAYRSGRSAWATGPLDTTVCGVYVVSWETLRGQIPALLKTSPKPTVRDIGRAMRIGAIPPWRDTGTWDLVIADDSDRIAFRSTLSASVIKLIASRNRLALSGRAEGSHPEGLWSTLNWLWPDEFKGFWPWAKDRFKVDPTHLGRSIKFLEIGEERRPGARWEGVPCVVRR